MRGERERKDNENIENGEKIMRCFDVARRMKRQRE
jgi:hypothetical protein